MKNLFIGFVILSFFFSCRKSENISDIPRITFVSFTSGKDLSGKDTAAVVTFEYEDGDGDLGSIRTDSLAENNLFIKFFEKKNGTWIEPVLLLPYDARIPNLTPKAKNKSISGEISDIIGLPPSVTNDTIKLSIYIVDRANHKSNVIETSELIISTH